MTTPGLLEIKKYRVQLYRYQINGETTDLSTCVEGSVSEWKAACAERFRVRFLCPPVYVAFWPTSLTIVVLNP